MTNISVWFIPNCSSGCGRELATHVLKSLSKEFSAWQPVTCGADFPKEEKRTPALA
jgi:hypothetical protein